jgi:hypothetical protein
MLGKLFSPPKDKRGRVASIPIPIRRSAEFWLDVFQSSLEALISNEDDLASFCVERRQSLPTDLAHTARMIADAALEEYENRWPNIKV